MKKYFSDIVVDFLVQQGIDCVAFNPGASFRGIHDSLVSNENTPHIFMTCHEEIAVAMAHGYFKASNRHMAVFIHANVGLLHATMAIFNAWCDRVPLLLIGGNGPLDADKRRPWIDWIHTSRNIDAVVKEFVKWSDEPISQRATIESLYRAFKLMNTEMMAPTYVAIDFDVQEQELESGVQLLPLTATKPSKLPGASDEFVKNLVDSMLMARMPVLITDFSGRNPDTVLPLMSIAESIGMAVIDRGNRCNFPNTHPLNISLAKMDIIKKADFVLAIEVQDLAGALKSFLEAVGNDSEFKNTTLFNISTNDTLISKWAADYQKFVPVSDACIADTLQTLQKIQNELSARSAKIRREVVLERTQIISKVHEEARASWTEEANAFSNNTAEIHVSTAVMEIYAAIKNKPWILTNTGSLTIDSWVKKLWMIDRPGSYLGLNGGGGLGYGLGASIGAALARRHEDVLCVDLQADGDFLYTPSALWTLSAYEIPLLVIMMNNRLYLNSTQHAEKIAQNRGRSTDLAHVATSFYEMPVDFIKIAQGFGIHTMPRVESVSSIGQTIDAAVTYIMEHKKAAFVEIVMK